MKLGIARNGGYLFKCLKSQQLLCGLQLNNRAVHIQLAVSQSIDKQKWVGFDKLPIWEMILPNQALLTSDATARNVQAYFQTFCQAPAYGQDIWLVLESSSPSANSRIIYPRLGLRTNLKEDHEYFAPIKISFIPDSRCI